MARFICSSFKKMISIIIPYVEDRGFLNEALESLHLQSFKDFEIILEQGECQQGENINRGLKKARGEYIKILHDDDMLPPHSLRDLHRGIRDFDWICANMETFGDPDYCNPEVSSGSTPVLSAMVNNNQIAGGTTMYRTSVLREIGGYDENLWTGEEYELHLRLLSKGYTVIYLPKVVHRYRLHKLNKSYDMPSKEKIIRRKYIGNIALKYK